MANYAIGDLQGCYKEFQDLLSQISFNEKEDKLWICGDLVNRGPESLQCLLYLHSIKKKRASSIKIKRRITTEEQKT